MSGLEGMNVTHDTTERLSYYLSSAVSDKRPGWQMGQVHMQQTCMKCHTEPRITQFYAEAEKVIDSTNKLVEEAKDIMDGLQRDGLLPSEPFVQPIQYRYFDLWHYAGRTAKHGAFMGGADFVQWHGFYEIVAKLAEIKRSAAELRDGRSHGAASRCGSEAMNRLIRSIRNVLLDPLTLAELFLLSNVAFLTVNVYVAHSVNGFAAPAESAPVAFSTCASLLLVLAMLIGGSVQPPLPPRSEHPRRAAGTRRRIAWLIGLAVGSLSIVVGLAGLILHLESSFFREMTVHNLVYAALLPLPWPTRAWDSWRSSTAWSLRRATSGPAG